ncbi:uncharacterized protein LOC111024982 [Momordica charantia]|uniref:Uncharacterized protein LOC111024982 n=1 Tax=Momordica charantia TaxID=3673 RepID=A0A6J1DZM0_MOMCH|nr:uncharacterized protein LOC111024982 [Momordica charantia]XP_022158509.1 uncharacterized protein LOC111024982 [Momordica charantia]
MIKRRFYRLEHANRDDASDSSMSSSDSEPEAGAEESQDDVEEIDESCSTSSGYESEDSSVNEVDVDSSGLPSTEDDPDVRKESQTPIGSQVSDESPSGTLDLQSDILSMEESQTADIPVCILKCKSVFKCRLCPRVVCLNEETLKAHLKSKRHARSEKLLNEGRLKIMLNDNGEIENPENPTESPPRLPAFPPENRRRKNKSKQSYGLPAKRSNKKEKKHLEGQMRGPTKSLVKKRRKTE